jgi:diguanylate cyclase (GGDEF)-like protein/PAS domain S-box-containing protein
MIRMGCFGFGAAKLNPFTFPDEKDRTMSGIDAIPKGRDKSIRLLAATIVVALASWCGLEMIRPGELSAFWLANGVLLAFLMITPRKHWAAYLSGGVVANVVVHLGYGYALLPSAQTAFANTLEIVIAAWWFRNTAPRRPDLTHAPTLVRFAVFGGVLGPLASALWVTFTTTHLVDYYSLAMRFRLWFVADSLGIILVTPLMLALLDADIKELFTGWRLAETVALLSLPFAAAVFSFLNQDFPFPFLVVVALIPVIFRLGLAGSAIGVLLVSFPAIHYTFAGRGPFVHAGRLYASLFLQIYFGILLGVAYVLTAILAEEQRLGDDLRKSESRYRALAESSQDLILRTTLLGVRTYISPAVVQVIGWTEEELPPANQFSVLVHPADRQKWAEFLECVGTQSGRHTLVFRIRRRDGHYGWMEAYVAAILNHAAVPDELVWTIRDISLRVAHEESLRIEKREAQELAWTDSLTGLSNRRAFDERFDAEWRFAIQHRISLSLLMLDVDNFKSYNDTYGHPGGDEVLRRIARVVGECTRQSRDLAARYGGEEFAVVLPYADAVRASEVAERIRDGVHELQMEHSESECGIVTVSVGIASIATVVDGQASLLIDAADRALYSAKSLGRNRIMLSA